MLVSKPGKDSTISDNQCPISLTCHTCKLMEKMVIIRFMLALERIQAFSDHQLEFRNYRSTQELLLWLDHDIRESF